VRRQLSLFALALAIPFLAFIGFVLFQFASSERAHLEDDTLGSARRVAVAVDREISRLVSALDVLALSNALALEDWPTFHAQVSRIRDHQNLVAVLRDMDGQQIVNARVPWGQPLPRFQIPGEETVLSRMRYNVSNVYRGVTTPAYLFSVTVPVMKNGQRRYLLSFSIPAEGLRDILNRVEHGANLTIAIIDRQGRIMARSDRHAEFVGQSASEDLMVNTVAREGVWTGTGAEGDAVFAAFTRTTFSDWRVVVSIRESALEAPLRRSLLVFGSVGLIFAGLALGASSFYARRIVRPMQRLARSAEALGQGQPVRPVDTRIPEVRLIGEALVAAADSLREREKLQRDFSGALEMEVAARTSDLVEANNRLIAEAEQRERAEQQLRQAQKMEAVGQLTGGIAHDFNNLLAVITGNLELLIRRLQTGRPNAERLASSALEASNRAATLTNRLLAFSRQQPLSSEPVDVNALVTGMQELIARAIGEGVEVGTRLQAGLWATHADPNQLENALLNLSVNARDAMPDGGRITIETANVQFGEGDVVEIGIPAGDYVMLAVADTGQGMTPGVMARAFEPFFTTKGPSHGTGLGLSQVYGFVRQSGGHVKIDSEPNHGTTVGIYLPRFRGAVNALGNTAAEPQLG
jgi:signal transduction histidine kinase